MNSHTRRRSTVWGAFALACTLIASMTTIAVAAADTTTPTQGSNDGSSSSFELEDSTLDDSGDTGESVDGLGFFPEESGGAIELRDDEPLTEGDAIMPNEATGPPLTDSRGLDGMKGKYTSLNVDVNLKLIGAQIVKFDPDDTDDEFVEFLFGEKVLDIYEPSSFKLIGVSSAEVVSGRQVFRDEKNPNGLIVGFAPGIDPTNFALAAVEPGAVGSIKGEINPGDSEVLIGSKVKDAFASAVPKLIGVQVEPSLERIVYKFDEKLDESIADPSLFGYYSFDGQLHFPSRITSVNDKEVIAKFDENNGDQVEEAVRGVVFAGAVQDKSGLPNPTGSFGGITTAPDVVKVYHGPTRTQFDFAFDQDVTSPKPEAFSLFTRLGKAYPAKDARLIAPNIVRVIVPAVREFSEEAVFGSVQPGAVVGDSGFGTKSTGGGLIVANKKLDDVGVVAGPELINVQVNAKESMVKFFFDELVDDDQFADPEMFQLISVSGAVQPGVAFVDADVNWIVVTYSPASIKSAVTAMVSANAVRDFEGNGNPPSVYK